MQLLILLVLRQLRLKQHHLLSLLKLIIQFLQHLHHFLIQSFPKYDPQAFHFWKLIDLTFFQIIAALDLKIVIYSVKSGLASMLLIPINCYLKEVRALDQLKADHIYFQTSISVKLRAVLRVISVYKKCYSLLVFPRELVSVLFNHFNECQKEYLIPLNLFHFRLFSIISSYWFTHFINQWHFIVFTASPLLFSVLFIPIH